MGNMCGNLDSVSIALSGLKGRGEVVMALEKVFAPLIAYDANKRSNLLLTLSTFVSNDGSVSVTAEKLFLHRNSVAYRLQRILEVGGIDLHDKASSRIIQLALAVTGYPNFDKEDENAD